MPRQNGSKGDRNGLPQNVTDAEILAAASATVEEAAADAKPTPRDIEQNYGGDAVKAQAMKAFDAGLPQTRVFVKFATDEVNQTYTSWKGTDKETPFDALRISLARLFEAGAFSEGGEFAGQHKGSNDKGMPVIEVTELLLEKAHAMYREFKASRPVTKAEASEALLKAVGPEGAVTFVKRVSRGKANLAEAEELAGKAASAFRTVALAPANSTDPIFREIYTNATEAVASANHANKEHIRKRALDLAKVLGNEAEVKDRIIAALKKSDKEYRDDLLEAITSMKAAIQSSGLEDPEESESRQTYDRGRRNDSRPSLPRGKARYERGGRR